MKSVLLTLVLVVLATLPLVLAQEVPEGATVTAGTPESANVAAAGSNGAKGGYITQANLSSETQTAVWQGYYGEVSGNITLEDASGDKMYQWSWLNTQGGEVYASTASSVTWTSIAVQQDCTTGETITGTGSDKVSLTFSNTTWSQFKVGSVSLGAYTCKTNTYVNSAPQSTNFEEVILTDGTNTVWATVVGNNPTGFDGATHDYQLIVPEDNRGNNVATNYYFWLELS